MTDRASFFTESDWTAGVLGLGYVGLPLAVAAVSRGLDVVGFDTSSDVIERLLQGKSHVDDVSDGTIAGVIGGGATFTGRGSELERADAVFICVPSPPGRNREPDLTFIEAAAATIADVARPGQR